MQVHVCLCKHMQNKYIRYWKSYATKIVAIKHIRLLWAQTETGLSPWICDCDPKLGL